MKYNKIIILVLLISIALMGAGYAIWNDSVNIAGTVATGEFNVKFVQSHRDVTHSPSNGRNYAPYVTYKVSPKKLHDLDTGTDPMYTDIISVEFNNIYPGVEMEIPVEIKNLGTIPARFKDAEIVFYQTDSNGKATTEKVSYDELNNPLKSALKIEELFYTKYDDDGDPINPGLNSVTGVNFSNLETKLEDLLGTLGLLDCGDVITVGSVEPVFVISLPRSVSDLSTCAKEFKFDIIMTWTQFDDVE